jgi:3'-5' exonuclease
MDIKKFAVFDIETAGKYASLSELRTAEPDMSILWKKRCEFLRERYPNNAELSDDELYVLKSGLHAEFAKVVCVSFGIYRDGIIIQSCASTDEQEVLRWTANMINNADRLGMNLCGHTIERFDIPVLFKRFLINGMKPPKMITLWGKKPWDITFFDMAKFWSNGAWQEGYTSLETMAVLFGHKSPKADTQANQVHEMFYSGRLDDIKTYCEGDVRASVLVVKSMLDTINTEN